MAVISGVFLIFLLPMSLGVRAQQDQFIVSLGSSLTPGNQPNSWASSSGLFAFGFYSHGNGFAVGIWLVGEQENTIVWTAYRNDPPVSSNASLDFTMDGKLLLRNGRGDEKCIHPDVLEPAHSASMLDTGNFVLYSKNSSVIWETFDHPTDTILGGQNLSSGDNLFSSMSRSDYSTGRFFLGIQADGNLVAYPVNSSHETDDCYWATGTNNGTRYELTLSNRGFLGLYANGSIVPVSVNISYRGDTKSTIYRATLDDDGIFRVYSHRFVSANNTSSIETEWSSLRNRCEVKGFCGLNSYCSDKHSDCSCYPGFTFIDERKKYLGCSQNFTDDACDGRTKYLTYYVTSLENIWWSDYPYYAYKQVQKEVCSKSCQEDCNCGAVLYNSSSGNCRKYKLPLRYGRRNENMSYIAFFTVFTGSIKNYGPMAPIRPTSIDGGNRSLILILGISLGSIACLCFVLAISSFLIYRHRVRCYRKLSNNWNLGITEGFALRSFSYSELEKATDGFQEELGRGSFGVVYKGSLPGDGKTIAIKRLEKIEEGERQFRAEITAIGRTSHRNLVRLLGFCVEGSRKLLVYEYMSRGSLANFLFETEGRPIWKDRVRIALDVARGILYLHEECEVLIIHCNIKPQNILIDDSLTAKISDFGLAKLLMPNQASTSGIVGTRGYSAPEWQMNYPISLKVDVYSFGVVLLEIICCRNSIEVKVPTADEIILSGWVYNCFVTGELDMLVKGEDVDLRMLERMVMVGLWCIQDNPTLRPSMKNVILMLEGTMDVAVPPPPTLLHAI